MAANRVTFTQLTPGQYFLAFVSLNLNFISFSQVIAFNFKHGMYAGELIVGTVEGPATLPLELSEDLTMVRLKMMDGSIVYQGPVNALDPEVDLPNGTTFQLDIGILTLPTGGIGALNINDDKYVEVQRRYLDG